MKKRLFYLAVFAIGATNAQEIKKDTSSYEPLDEVFISDSKFKLRGVQSGKHIIKITREELEKQTGSLASLINTKSGIEINGSRSNAGQNLAYYLRGGNNRQVLIVIDGIQVSDPSQIANDFDLRLIDINQIEHVEIIKGAASTLYGNSAAAGVINITTRKNTNKKFSGYFSSRIGTNKSQDQGDLNINEINQNLSLNGNLKKLNYSLALSQFHTNGLSAVARGTEKDPFTSEHLAFKLSYTAQANFIVSAFINLDKYDASYDNAFPLEDAFFKSEGKLKRIGLSPKLLYSDGSLHFNASYLEVDRKITSNFPNEYKAKKQVIDFYNKYNFGSNVHIVVGLNYVKNEALFGVARTDVNLDPYINLVWNLPIGLNLNLGGRTNNHSEYGNHFIYNFNPSFTYQWDDRYLKVFSSYSTSFIAPSLSQLFGPYGANIHLKPESNRTIEFGGTWKHKKYDFTLLYFDRSEKDFIDFVTIDPITFESQYKNVLNEFSVSGIEFDMSLELSISLRLSTNYTFTDKKEKKLRIPKHKVNAGLSYQINDGINLELNYQFTDSRLDVDFITFQNIKLNDFSTFDLLFSQQLIKNRLKLSGGITNIFNATYNELIGYSTKGRNFNIGVLVQF